jgi:DNA-binding CsgD family transcriptional regulator/predicted negative regulator of RcsB-dependent stress response
VGIEVASGAGLVGREEELALIDAFLGTASSSPGALVVTGEAGVGKTTLWLHAVTVARERSFGVLACRPSQAETELSFGALADLLADDAHDVIAELPAPQRQALDVALRRTEPGPEPPDQFAIRTGFLGILRALAALRPLVVAVDDVQWLDRPTELALAFAARRLRDEQVAFVVARRGDGDGTLPLDLARVGPERSVVELAVGRLSLGAIHRLLRSRLETSIRRPVLRKIHETSGGNPFYAVELGRELVRRDDFELASEDPLPLPASLDALVRDRLARLSPRTREIMLAASSLAQPSVALLEATYGRRVVASALAEAMSAGVVEHERARVLFSHPLVASACYVGAAPVVRRRMHVRLARAVSDPEERARHLALSVEGADAEVAQALDEAADHAARRGAPEVAADLADLALARSPTDGPEAVPRMLAAGDYSLRSGDSRRARDQFRAALQSASPGEKRANVLVRLAEAEEDPAIAIEVCEQALAEQTGPTLTCRIHQRLARACHLSGLGMEALHHARAARDVAETIGDDDLLVAALTESAEIEFFYGKVDAARRFLQGALDLESRVVPKLRESPRLSLARVLAFRDLRYRKALTIFSELLQEAEQRGDEWARHRILWNVSALHHTAGDFQEAHRSATEGLELAETDGSDVLPFLVRVATSAAYLGRVDEAEGVAKRGLSLAESVNDSHAFYLHHTLGLLELSRGRLEAADRHLRASAAVWDAWGSPADADGILLLADRIELLIALGKREQARALLARFETMGSAHPFPGQRALVGRCRGLVIAADGDTSVALKAFEAALADHARAEKPFERARTLLCYGATLRRAKRRGDAREVLNEALAEFERLSTPLWAEKARAEHSRIGGRTRSGQLTETERRLAELVAEGRSNKEVAAALFLTPKTVSTQLSRIYAKLGIHSRSELVRFVLERSKV